MTRKRWTVLLVVAILAVAGTAYFRLRASDEGPVLQTAVVTRGDVVEIVEATGTLSPVDTVEVGAQVTGRIESLHADFNDRVVAGQVLARLEPEALQAQVDQAAATVHRLQAEVNRAEVTLQDAETKLARAEALAAQQLISQADLDAARSTRDAARAALVSARAQVVQAEASLKQARVNLGHTIIRSPTSGIVLSRNVEVGQTVTSGLQTPTLFVIARDLERMEVQANVDESDIGRVQAGQPVTFTVDAYGNRTFTGRVSAVRLQPVVEQNVVTYTTIIEVENPDLLLKPGMTATVRIETGRAENALVVPSAALRFRPTADLLQAMGGPDAASAPQGQSARGAADREAPVVVWTVDNGLLRPVHVRPDVSDGATTAIRSKELDEGTEVVTGVLAGTTMTSNRSSGGSPLVPTRPRRTTGGSAGRTTR
ncbi:MAG TPA: efflux RND transporter periplasmic adaptor subunit [Vicinamibacterales bacterium]